MALMDALDLGFHFLPDLWLQIAYLVSDLILQVGGIIHDPCSAAIEQLNLLNFGNDALQRVIPSLLFSMNGF